ENAADIVLFKQRLDGALRQFLVAVRQIDQVGAAIGRDHEVRLGGILAEQAVAGLGMGAVGYGGVLVVGIGQRQVEGFRQIERQEAHRQKILRRVGVADLCGRTALALFRNGREAVVG